MSTRSESRVIWITSVWPTIQTEWCGLLERQVLVLLKGLNQSEYVRILVHCCIITGTSRDEPPALRRLVLLYLTLLWRVLGEGGEYHLKDCTYCGEIGFIG